jgi:hypothetical protein
VRISSAPFSSCSGIAALVAGVAFYVLLSRLGNRVVAVAVVLAAQTGQHPLQPRFRMGEYVVGTDDPAVIAEIARINEANVGADYLTIYR